MSGWDTELARSAREKRCEANLKRLRAARLLREAAEDEKDAATLDRASREGHVDS